MLNELHFTVAMTGRALRALETSTDSVYNVYQLTETDRQTDRHREVERDREWRGQAVVNTDKPLL